MNSVNKQRIETRKWNMQISRFVYSIISHDSDIQISEESEFRGLKLNEIMEIFVFFYFQLQLTFFTIFIVSLHSVAAAS